VSEDGVPPFLFWCGFCLFFLLGGGGVFFFFFFFFFGLGI